MSKQHRDIVTAQRHNLKDFEDADNSTVASKDENGNLIWVSKDDIGGSQGPQGPAGLGVQTIEVADIENPATEMATVSGTQDGELLVVYQELGAGGHDTTIYSWDDTAPPPAINPPYVVQGDGGKWIASAGTFSQNEKRTAQNSTYLPRIPVLDINDPSELNNRGGVEGDTVKVYTIEGTDNNKSSIYMLDPNTTEPENPPYCVDALGSGKWIMEATTSLTAHSNVANGLFNESVRGVLSEAGGIVSIAIDAQGGGDLVAIVNGTEVTIDTTPAKTVALTAGSDSSPTLNYVYFDNTQALVKSTVGFPAAFHHKVGTFLIQSPTSFANDAAYKEHMHINNLISADAHGELEHLTQWIRKQHSTWDSGVALTPIVGVSTFDIQTSAGISYQLHPNDFPAQDTSVTDPIWVVNDNATPYNRVTDMATILTDSDGDSMSNTRFNLVIWGSVNQDNSKLYCNLPNGSYNNDADAIADVNGTSNFNVPNDFRGTGFLIGRLTVKHVAGTSTWSILQNEDLRGQFPGNAVGGSGSFTTEFSDNVFRVFNVADNTKVFEMDLSNIGTGTTRTLTMANNNVDLDNVLDIASYNAAKGIAKSALAALDIDMSGDKFKTKTIVAPSTFTISNPVLGSVVQVEVDGDFAITLPSTVRNKLTVEGAYDGTASKKNLLSIECIDSATPVYWASIMVGD